MSTEDTAALIDSVGKLTETVAGKIGEIDDRMSVAEKDLMSWKATTSYVQKYVIGGAELSNNADRNTGNYNLIKLYTVTDAYKAINPWLHLGWSGGNVVGAGLFCSLAQSHASYTGQQAMFSKRGNGILRFFIDRTNQNRAPVYVALRNNSFNNASVGLSIASYVALGVEAQGAVDLDVWLLDNPNVVEIDLIDITVQPV